MQHKQIMAPLVAFEIPAKSLARVPHIFTYGFDHQCWNLHIFAMMYCCARVSLFGDYPLQCTCVVGLLLLRILRTKCRASSVPKCFNGHQVVPCVLSLPIDEANVCGDFVTHFTHAHCSSFALTQLWVCVVWTYCIGTKCRMATSIHLNHEKFETKIRIPFQKVTLCIILASTAREILRWLTRLRILISVTHMKKIFAWLSSHLPLPHNLLHRGQAIHKYVCGFRCSTLHMQ